MTAHFNNIPVELLRIIVDEIDDIDSVLALSTTCRFWQRIFWYDDAGFFFKTVAESTSQFLKPGPSDSYLGKKNGGSLWYHCTQRYSNTIKTIHGVVEVEASRPAAINQIPDEFDTAVSLVVDGDPQLGPFIPTFDVGKKSFRGRSSQTVDSAYRLSMILRTFEVFGDEEVLPLKTGRSHAKHGQEFFAIFESDDPNTDMRLVVVKLRHDRFKALLVEGGHVIRKVRLGFETRLQNPIFAFNDGLLFMCDDGRMFIFDMLVNKQVAYRSIDYKGTVSSLAISQTHMWLVNAYAPQHRTVYAIPLTTLIDPQRSNAHIPLKEWTKVMDLNFGNYNMAWKFGAFKFYGRFVCLVRGKNLLTIDLFAQKATYYCIPSSYSDDGRWVLDMSGKPVYFEQQFIDELVSQYKKRGYSGRVAMPELFSKRPKLFHI